VGITTFLLWRNLPVAEGAPRFRKNIIAEVWRFALGMSGTSFFSFFLSQSDKVILSKLLTLEHFGYYSLAVTLNEQLQIISAQITQPLFPRFSAYISQNDHFNLRDLYHKACQLMSVIILPVVGTAAFFSRELIFLWTQDMQIASVVAPIATLLFTGTALINMVEIPFSLAIAYGWVRFTFIRSVLLSILVVPLMIALSLKYGGIGAALTWVVLNLGQVLFIPYMIHTKFLKGEFKRWSIFDVGIPAVFSLAILGLARWLMPLNLPSFQYIVMIGSIIATIFFVAVLSAREARLWGIELIGNYFQKRA
jgi:O-antigen/teichoic acid export membrane protein